MLAATVFLTLSILFFLYVAVFFFSKRNIFFSPEVKGEVKVATISGVPWKFFGSLSNGKYLMPDGKTVAEGERHVNPKTGMIEGGKGSPSLLQSLFQVTWIGLWPYGGIYKWEISFSKWVQETNGKMKLDVVHNRKVDSIHALPTFAFIVTEAETQDQFRLTIKGKYTLTLVNAMAALFTTKNWRQNIESAIEGAIADIIRGLTYDKIFGKQFELGAVSDGSNIGLVEGVRSLNDDNIGSNPSIRRYGFLIEDLSITSVEISGGNREELIKATTLVTIAKKKAQAIAAEATGSLNAARKEAQGIEALRLALGENSDQIGMLEIAKAISKHQGNLALGGGIMPTMDMSKKEEKK